MLSWTVVRLQVVAVNSALSCIKQHTDPLEESTAKLRDLLGACIAWFVAGELTLCILTLSCTWSIAAE